MCCQFSRGSITITQQIVIGVVATLGAAVILFVTNRMWVGEINYRELVMANKHTNETQTKMAEVIMAQAMGNRDQISILDKKVENHDFRLGVLERNTVAPQIKDRVSEIEQEIDRLLTDIQTIRKRLSANGQNSYWYDPGGTAMTPLDYYHLIMPYAPF